MEISRRAAPVLSFPCLSVTPGGSAGARVDAYNTDCGWLVRPEDELVDDCRDFAEGRASASPYIGAGANIGLIARAVLLGAVHSVGLDVFEVEPATSHKLFGLENVVATPHLGASTDEAQVNVAVAIAEQVVAFLSRGAITAAVNMPALTPEQREVIAPFLAIGEKLGSLAGQLCAVDTPPCSGAPVEVAVEAFGADRCMWGSDFPHVLAGCGYVRNRNFLPREAKFLSKAHLDAILGGTAERLWFG